MSECRKVKNILFRFRVAERKQSESGCGKWFAVIFRYIRKKNFSPVLTILKTQSSNYKLKIGYENNIRILLEDYSCFGSFFSDFKPFCQWAGRSTSEYRSGQRFHRKRGNGNSY
jgi:hypothetical protein